MQKSLKYITAICIVVLAGLLFLNWIFPPKKVLMLERNFDEVYTVRVYCVRLGTLSEVISAWPSGTVDYGAFVELSGKGIQVPIYSSMVGYADYFDPVSRSVEDVEFIPFLSVIKIIHTEGVVYFPIVSTDLKMNSGLPVSK